MTTLHRYYSTIKTFNTRGPAIFLLLFVLALPLLPFLFLFSASTQDRLQSRLAELLRAINSRGDTNKANIRIASFRSVKVALSSMVLIGIFILCLVSLPNSVSTESPPPEATAQVKQGTGSKQSEALINTPHRIFAPHWSNENGTTTIYIRNIDIRQGVFARLSLILKHRIIALPETYIDSLQTISIDLAQSLMLNGERDDQSGGAILDFEAESDSALVAYAQIVNPDKGLSLNFPFLSGTTPAMPGGPTHPGPLETVAWYLNDKTDAFIALQNTTDKPAMAIPTMFISGRAVSLGQRQLKPYEPITIKLPSPYMSGYEKGQRSALIRVEYKGEAGAVEVEGWVVNEEIGFSAALTFHRKIIDCHCPDGVRHLYGTGIAIGRGAMMGLTPGAVFSPYLAMGNRSRAKITINPIFSYHLGDEVEKVSLPPVLLNPQESALVNLQEYQESGIIPSTVSDGSIDLQYRGEAGALMAELASVDQDGSFVSPVPLTCNGQRLAEMAFWRTDGDWHSSLSFWNVAAEKMRLEIKISYPSGEYEIEKEIAAGAAGMVSVNELQESQEPDEKGRTIPPGVTLGGVSIRSKNQVNGLVMNAMLVNPVTKTCAECGGYGYVRYCVLTDDITSTATHKYTIHRAVNETFPMYIVVTYSTGFQEIDNAEIIGNTNPSVAVAPGGNIVTTVSPGTTKLTGRTYFDDYPLDRFCSVHGKLETSGDLKAIQLKIKQDGVDITDQSRDVIVGQKISLAVEVLPAGTSFTNLQWTIAPKTVASYVIDFIDPGSNTSAKVTKLPTVPTTSSVVFYWVDGGDGRQVKYTLKVNNTPFTALTTFNVKRPTNAFITVTPQAAITVDGACSGFLELHFGCMPPNAGVQFQADAVFPSGFNGNLALVQIVDSFVRKRITTAGQTLTQQGSGVLDTQFPYPFFFDSPGQKFLVGDNRVTVNDNFSMYLLFKPQIAGAIWVPLRKVSWQWAGDALVNGTLTSSSHSPNLTGVDVTDPPEWNGNVTLIPFQ